MVNHGRPMAYPWVTHSLSVGYGNVTHGLYMRYPWTITGKSWATNGLPLGCPWSHE